MERIEEVKIIVDVKTNKSTYKKEFDNMNDANEYADYILENVNKE